MNKYQIAIIPKSENLYKKFQKYKNLFGKVQYHMYIILGILEKLKNLFTWDHPIKTGYATLGIIGLLFLINILPFKEIGLIILTSRAIKGYKYYKTLFQHNAKVVDFIIKFTIQKQNFSEFSENLQDKDAEWLQSPNILEF